MDSFQQIYSLYFASLFLLGLPLFKNRDFLLALFRHIKVFKILIFFYMLTYFCPDRHAIPHSEFQYFFWCTVICKHLLHVGIFHFTKIPHMIINKWLNLVNLDRSVNLVIQMNYNTNDSKKVFLSFHFSLHLESNQFPPSIENNPYPHK